MGDSQSRRASQDTQRMDDERQRERSREMSWLINGHVRLINGLSTTNHGMASRGYEHKYQLCVTRTAHRPRALEGARRVLPNRDSTEHNCNAYRPPRGDSRLKLLSRN